MLVFHSVLLIWKIKICGPANVLLDIQLLYNLNLSHGQRPKFNLGVSYFHFLFFVTLCPDAYTYDTFSR